MPMVFLADPFRVCTHDRLKQSFSILQQVLLWPVKVSKVTCAKAAPRLVVNKRWAYGINVE